MDRPIHNLIRYLASPRVVRVGRWGTAGRAVRKRLSGESKCAAGGEAPKLTSLHNMRTIYILQCHPAASPQSDDGIKCSLHRWRHERQMRCNKSKWSSTFLRFIFSLVHKRPSHKKMIQEANMNPNDRSNPHPNVHQNDDSIVISVHRLVDQSHDHYSYGLPLTF